MLENNLEHLILHETEETLKQVRSLLVRKAADVSVSECPHLATDAGLLALFSHRDRLDSANVGGMTSTPSATYPFGATVNCRFCPAFSAVVLGNDRGLSRLWTAMGGATRSLL